MQDFAGCVAVVTGGGGGAGRALAHACAADGMRVVVADIEGDAAEAVAAAIREGGGEAIAVRTDIADRASVDALAERTRAAFGAERDGLVLFQNAGVMKTTPLAEATSEDWEWIIAVNLWGVIHSVQAFLPLLREQEGPAQIVLTSSMSGLVGRANVNGVYTATKHAVVGYSNVLRHELAPEGIGVSCWCPSRMDTQIRNAVRVAPAALRRPGRRRAAPHRGAAAGGVRPSRPPGRAREPPLHLHPPRRPRRARRALRRHVRRLRRGRRRQVGGRDRLTDEWPLTPRGRGFSLRCRTLSWRRSTTSDG